MDYFLDEQNLVCAGNPHLAELETDVYRKVTISILANDAIEQQREEIVHLERRCEKALLDITEYRQFLPIQVRVWKQPQEETPLQRKRIEMELECLEEEVQRRLPPIQAQLVLLIKLGKKIFSDHESCKSNLACHEHLFMQHLLFPCKIENNTSVIDPGCHRFVFSPQWVSSSMKRTRMIWTLPL